MRPKQLDIHKTCAVTLTGKRPPNRDPEWQRTELVQDSKALMVQDTKQAMTRVMTISYQHEVSDSVVSTIVRVQVYELCLTQSLGLQSQRLWFRPGLP